MFISKELAKNLFLLLSKEINEISQQENILVINIVINIIKNFLSVKKSN